MERRIGERLNAAARAWRALVDYQLREQGVSQSRWLPLVHLLRAGVPLSQVDLARSIGIEPPSLVPLIDWLEAQGWVSRTTSIDDRRSKLIAITPAGAEKAQHLRASTSALVQEISALIAPEEMSIAMRTLDKIQNWAETRLDGMRGEELLIMPDAARNAVTPETIEVAGVDVAVNGIAASPSALVNPGQHHRN